MRIQSLILAFLMAIPALASAAERGVFGFGLTVESEGFFLNPTLRSLKISKVAPKSPAQSAGLQVGDDVVEVEGRLVAGAKARDIQALAEKDVGQRLTLKVQHRDGKLEVIAMTSVEKLEK